MARILRCFVTLGLSLLCAVPLAHAGSITTFVHDTTAAGTQRSKGTPPDVVDLPIWVGANSAVGVLHVSDAFDISSFDAAPLWLGASVTYPWKSSRQGWFEVNYERFRFLQPRFGVLDTTGGVFTLISPGQAVTFDQFAVRWGVEQRFGRLDRPFATLGAGVGYASGFGSTAGSDDGMFTLQGIGRATAFLYLGRTSRVGLGVEAGPNLSYIPHQDVSLWTHAEVTVRWESMLRLPKRILPAP